MNWQLILQVIYVLCILGIIIKVVYDTSSSITASAYILLIILLPIIGVIIYLATGLNYRKSEIYNKKLTIDTDQAKYVANMAKAYLERDQSQFETEFSNFSGLSRLLLASTNCLLTQKNKITLLNNGENKFRALLQALSEAKHHIHMEYYIYSDNKIGNEVADILIQKAKQGVKVRFIYDDFGARAIRHTLAPKMRAFGIEAFAFYEIKLIYLANRINYRNHRKIVVIDGEKAFTGGINVSDEYINTSDADTFWRDTHLMLEGEAVWEIQKIFLADWNFCSNQNIEPTVDLFRQNLDIIQDTWTQIVPSGPDSKSPNILYSYLQAITVAKSEICITTPYLVPGEEFLYALHMAVLRGIEVKIIVPEISDSYIVNAVSKSYYGRLMEKGVKVYQYQKGFIHAKTTIIDNELSMVGTANIDHRSFDLNFEVNALVYDTALARALKSSFINDLSQSQQIDKQQWLNRNKLVQFWEKLLRLVSPIM